MLNHIVIFKLKEEADGRNRFENSAILKARLLELKDYIPEIKEMEVGVKDKSAPETHFDIYLSTKFETLDDLNLYRTHPKHLEVVNFIKEITSNISAIDFSESSIVPTSSRNTAQ